MQYDHVVSLTNEGTIGLDRHDTQWTVCSARELLVLVEKPAPGNDILLRRYEQAVEFLRELDHHAVLVSPFGSVVGEYQVSPYIITMKEYSRIEDTP